VNAELSLHSYQRGNLKDSLGNLMRITLVDNVPTLVPVLQPTTNVQQPLTMQPSITGNISLIPCSSVTSLKSSNMPSVSGNQAAIRLQPTVVLSHNRIFITITELKCFILTLTLEHLYTPFCIGFSRL
jgi:hypothetical protein